MKNKIKISSVLTILIITSLFYPVNALDITIHQLPANQTEGIEIIKTVWNPDLEEWVDYYEAEINELVTFNINITYKKTCPDGMNATDIIIVDSLPENLSFDDSYPYTESWIDGNQIYWNLTADYGINLTDNESLSIEFTASVEDYGEHENFVEVFAFEICTHINLYGCDLATVNAEAPPYIEFDKYVYDPEKQEWVELIDTVMMNQVVRFRIDAKFVWHEEIDIIKFMVVEDFMDHCCLQYVEDSEEFIYPSQDFEDPEITVELNHAIYNWSEKEFNLFAGETITIIFNSTVVEYCDQIIENWAYVDMWNCSPCHDPNDHLTDSDYASVNCTAAPPIFDKWVKDPDSGELIELIDVYLYDEVKFKIELTYFGNYNLSNINIVDQLPCALDFDIGSASPTESAFSEDLKTIWWNFTEPLDDSETLTIEFSANVVDDSCGEYGINIAIVNAYEQQEPYTASDTAGVFVLKNNPPCPPDITGDTFGEPLQELTFNAIGTDPEGNDIFYMFDWGDDTQTDWLGPYESGEGIEMTHIWEDEGTYQVSAKLKDDPFGDEGLWSLYPVEVKIEKIPRSLEVELRLGFQRGISFEIENTGDGNVTNINWSVTVTRRGLFERVLLNKEGTISTLSPDCPDNEITIKELPKFGLWFIEVNVNVDSPDIENQIKINAKGFIILRFIRLRRFF